VRDMNKLTCCILAFLFVIVPVYAQQSEEPFSETQAMLQETVQQSDNSETVNDYNSEQNPQQRFEEDPKYNVHEYDYKQQIVVGGTVMFCVVLAMVLNNNYNPKRGK